jgi:hypothetical protein
MAKQRGIFLSTTTPIPPPNRQKKQRFGGTIADTTAKSQKKIEIWR